MKPRTAFRLALAAALLVAALASPAQAAAARIVAPPYGHAVVLGHSFRLVAELPKNAGHVRARLSSHDVSDRLHEVRPGRYAGRIPSRLAGGAGFGLLLITYRDSAGPQLMSRELIVAGRHQRPHQPPRGHLLSAGLASHRVAGVARLHLSAPNADQWSVRVNGRDVSGRFADHAGILRDGSLSASTGLHRGLNHVAVIAARENGSRALRRFDLRVDGPIPDAGPPRQVGVGDLVHLGSPGGAAEPSRPGDLLEHSWQLVSAPKRSKAELRHTDAERPSFRPDVNGSYWISDQVTERTKAGKLVGRSARDLVEVAVTLSEVPPIGLPIETLQPHYEPLKVGIEYGGTWYEQESFFEGTFEVMTIDPKTLAASSKTYGTAGEALQAIESVETGTIVVLQGVRLPLEESWTKAISEKIGAPGNWAGPARGKATGTTFSVIGVRGIPAGQGWANASPGPTPGSNGTWGVIHGYIAPNYQTQPYSTGGSYVFTPSTYSSYDTNTTGAGKGATELTARLGTTTVSGSVPAGQEGFLVAEFRASNLELLAHQNFAIAAAGAGEATSTGAQQLEEMASWLEAREKEPGVLILIQSIGEVPNHPFPSSANYSAFEAWSRISRAIGNLGGHEDLFNRGSSTGYSLLSGNGLVEAGVPAAEDGGKMLSYLQSEPEVVRLAGQLQLGHLGAFVPAVNTPISTANSNGEYAAVANFELPLIAYQAPTPWPYEPHTKNEDAAVVAAGHYISKQLCGATCNDELRHQYTVPNFDFKKQLSDAEFKCPEQGEWEGTAFEEEDCKLALAEFKEEVSDVEEVRTYLGTGENGILHQISGLVEKDNAGLEAIGNAIHAKIEEELHPPKASVSVSWVIIFQSFATALEAVESDLIPGVAPIATLIDAGLNAAQSYTVNNSGENVYQGETEIDEGVARMSGWVAAEMESFENLRALILTDYAKLSTISKYAAGTYPLWNLPEKKGGLEEQLKYGLRGAYYRTLVPTLTSYSDVVPPQNLCTNHRDAEGTPAPLPPECGGENPAAKWEPIGPRFKPMEAVVCWFYLFGWQSQKLGQSWEKKSYVVPEENAIENYETNPYFTFGGVEGSAYSLGISPTWHIAINTQAEYSSREAPFPASIAKEMSAQPELGNLAAGLPPWVLFELFPAWGVAECPTEWGRLEL